MVLQFCMDFIKVQCTTGFLFSFLFLFPFIFLFLSLSFSFLFFFSFRLSFPLRSVAAHSSSTSKSPGSSSPPPAASPIRSGRCGSGLTEVLPRGSLAEARRRCRGEGSLADAEDSEEDGCVSGSREVPPRGGLAEARRRRWISGRQRQILRRRVRDVLKTRGAEKEGEPDY